MGLNIKNPQVEALAAEVAKLAHETKTEAIRRALEERKARLSATSKPVRSKERAIEFLERHIWSKIPADVLGKPVTKQEREEILGFGPDGV
jgi:antitoxin VapB